MASSTKGSALFAGQLTQSATNTDTWLQIPTGLDPGGGTVIEFESMEVYWRNGSTTFTNNNDEIFEVSVARSPVVPSLANTDVFGMIAVHGSFTNIGAVASFTESAVVPVMFDIDLEPALTLQPYIYVAIHSANLGAAVSIDYRITYSTAKVSGQEYLRLLASGT